jgi:protein phosphatase
MGEGHERMDRIALISDIHGNVPALQAALHDIERRRIQRIFCLGDLVGKGPHSEKVVDICRAVCERTLKGNWDDALATTETDNLTLQWHQRRLGDTRLAFLRDLPNTIEFVMSGKRIRLFHASQKSVHYRVRQHDPVEKLLAMFDNTDFTGSMLTPDVVGYGDIHEAYVRSFLGRTLFNVGSVGNPHDTPQAAYGVLEGAYGGEAEDGLSIHLIRVPYDIELAIRQARDENMPSLEPYAHELRTAQYRGPAEYAQEREALKKAHGVE